MSGKNREKSGNFEVDDKWQPCQSIVSLTKPLGKDLLSLLVLIKIN